MQVHDVYPRQLSIERESVNEPTDEFNSLTTKTERKVPGYDTSADGTGELEPGGNEHKGQWDVDVRALLSVKNWVADGETGAYAVEN